ncbi:putative minor capsid protein [uncultured Enterococcus sp.]|uniref:putative minor capsid protein n=1 Tax=uncultured Enterococcus sp. TaxID=167972 RepID=UPI002AA726E3|nr:putative minor capsid protein [uncultured Enterococcus sp.]
MRFRLPPKAAYPHEIVHRRLTEKNKWQNPSYDEKTIQNVRFDASFDFNRSNSGASEKMPNALISMFDRYTGPLPAFATEDEIIWNGESYTIVAVVPLYFTSTDRIGYELEVV